MKSNTKAQSDSYEKTITVIHRVFWNTQSEPTEREKKRAEAYLLRWAVTYLDVLLPHICRDFNYAQSEAIPADLTYWDNIRAQRERGSK